MSLRRAWRDESANWIRFAQTPEHDRYYTLLNLPSFLELLPSPGQLTVDVGCGEGRLGRELSARGHRVLGFDYSEPAVRALNEARKSDLGVVADAGDLPLPDDSVDLVIAFMSLQDMDDPPATIEEVGRVLIPGGRFCFAILHPFISAGDFVEAKRAFRIERPYWEQRRHEYHSNRDGIELTFWQMHRPMDVYMSALERSGLQVEAMREPRPAASFELELDSARLMPVFLHVRATKP